MIFHSVPFFAYAWDCLHKTDHGLVTVGIEFSIVTCLDSRKLLNIVFQGILRNLRLEAVFEIRNKPYSVLKLDFERLVVYRRPISCNMLLRTVFASTTEDCLDLKLVHQFDFPDVFFLKLELMIVAN